MGERGGSGRYARDALSALVVLAFGACDGDAGEPVGCQPACAANETCEARRCVSRCAPSCGSAEACDAQGRCLGSVAWRVPLEGLPEDAAVAADGRIFITTRALEREVGTAWLDAFEAGGARRWHQQIWLGPDLVGPSRPVLGPSGDLFFALAEDLVAVDAAGGKRWTLDYVEALARQRNFGVVWATPPAVAADGSIYYQHLVAIDAAAGGVRWTSQTPEDATILGCDSAFPLRSDRVLHVMGTIRRFGEKEVRAIDPSSGAIAWKAARPFGGGCQLAPVGADALAWAVCLSKECDDWSLELLSLQDGRTLHTIRRPAQMRFPTPMVVRDDGVLALVDLPLDQPEAHLWLVDPARPEDPGRVATLPEGHAWVDGATVGDDGVLYLASTRGAVALDHDAHQVWSFRPEAESLLSRVPAISPTGCLLLPLARRLSDGAVSWELLCLNISSRQAKSSPWPRSFLGGNAAALRRD